MARKLDVMYQGAFSYSIYIEESFAGLAAAVEMLGLRDGCACGTAVSREGTDGASSVLL